MISVIVPVYNVAAYLSACLDSVLSQTYTDIELLLVDDGSTDGSADLCDDYACRDARVTVFHQSNAGPAAARNVALEVAQGEYVAFVDSDDVIHRRYLEILLETMARTGADIVQAPYQIVPDSTRSKYDALRLSQALPERYKQVELTGEEALLSMLYQRGTLDSSPCKLFRRTSIGKENFPTGYRVYEDLYFLAMVYPSVQKTVWIDLPMYFYFKQDSGTLNSLSIKRNDAFDVLSNLEQLFLVQGHKQWVRAVRERRLSVSFNILRILSRQPHTDANIVMAHRCWANICKLRRESISDSHARLKNRLVSAFSYLIKR